MGIRNINDIICLEVRVRCEFFSFGSRGMRGSGWCFWVRGAVAPASFAGWSLGSEWSGKSH